VADNLHSPVQPGIARPFSRLSLRKLPHGVLPGAGPLLRLRQWLARPTDALPLDILRVLVGLVTFIYFLQTFLDVGSFSSPDGLIDHELSQSIFWFTRIGLFHPGLGLRFFQAIFLIACLCTWPLILGYRVKLFAAILYLIAVCTYRWNFLVMYVDDSIVHLALFWLLLLPIGRTLVLRDWLTDRSEAWQRWKYETVPGGAVRCLMFNLALIYLVAGLWKWTSPMWRDGTALYVILKTPTSLSPDFWGPQHFPMLKLLNYCALILEPLFPLMFILRKGHRMKYALLLGLLGFHLGTLVTLKIPFANLICIGALVVPFGRELMDPLRRRQPSATNVLQTSSRLGFSGVVALIVVTALTLAMLSSAILPHWRSPPRDDANGGLVVNNTFKYEGLETLQWSFFSVLWSIGIAQQYQLFNWIDDRNYSYRYEIIEYHGDKPTPHAEPDTTFPRSTRGNLLQLYLHRVTWMRIPNERQHELRASLQRRFARRHCQQFQTGGDVAVYSTLERVYPVANRIEEDRVLFMSFRCQHGEPEMQVMNLDP
jgi:hypothetical protein